MRDRQTIVHQGPCLQQTLDALGHTTQPVARPPTRPPDSSSPLYTCHLQQPWVALTKSADKTATPRSRDVGRYFRKPTCTTEYHAAGAVAINPTDNIVRPTWNAVIKARSLEYAQSGYRVRWQKQDHGTLFLLKRQQHHGTLFLRVRRQKQDHGTLFLRVRRQNQDHGTLFLLKYRNKTTASTLSRRSSYASVESPAAEGTRGSSHVRRLHAYTAAVWHRVRRGRITCAEPSS